MVDDIEGNTTLDTEHTERAYTTKETAIMLDIAVPTLRKYAQSLERAGYTFLRGKGTGQHQARLFLEKDIRAIRYLKDIREKGSMTVKQATDVVMHKFDDKAIQTVRSSDIRHNGQPGKRYTELKELIQQQRDLMYHMNEQLNEQRERMDKQNKIIRNLSDQLEHQRSYIGAQLETQKQISASKEDEGLNKQTEHFQEQFDRQNELLSNLSERLERQQEHIDETKKQIAATDKKEGLFSRIFKRGK